MRTGGLRCAFVLSAVAACGGGSGDAPAPGGGGQDGGVAASADRAPPVVSAAPTVTAASETSIRMVWPAAVDEVTPAAKLVYRVYAGVDGAPVSYGAPIAVSPAGASGLTLVGLRSGRRYTLVARAVDEAANEDGNTLAADITLIDKTPPVFDGVRSAVAVARDAIEIRWAAARDDGDTPRALKYRVYVATKSGEQSYASPVLESGVGASSVTLHGLAPSTKYFIVARAVDAEGNTDQNTVQRTATTLEGVAPKFDGVVAATGAASSVTLRWYPAKDDSSATLDVVYDVFQASAAKGEAFATPTLTTAPGATSVVVPGLPSPATYYFVVRARDVAGNSDTNTREIAVATKGADATAPVFGGVQSATSLTPTTMRLAWQAAVDDVTPPRDIVYDVFVAPAAGGETLSTPSFTSAPGATSFTLTGLMPATPRFVVVRARDAAGNRDTGVVEATATTAAAVAGDVAPPVWASGPVVSRVESEPGYLGVTWGAATDAVAGAAGVRYHLCAETVEARCLGAAFDSHIRATTPFGATGAYVTGLTPRTTYFVVVRAEDRAGNLEAAGHGQVALTATSFAENVAPLLDARCGACHAYTYDRLVKVPSPFVDTTLGALALVTPGDAAASYLFRKLLAAGSSAPPFSPSLVNTYGGDRMPSDGTLVLSSDEIAPLREWIEQGAYER